VHDVSIALLHHPVLDRRGKTVTAAVTSLDLHDLARISRTYNLRNVFVVHPVEALRGFALRVRDHWFETCGREFDSRRRDALELVEVVATLEDAESAIERRCRMRPILIHTSARTENGASFSHVRERIHREKQPFLILLGTGFGLAPSVAERAEIRLEPVRGAEDYNHLPVRAAAAIILDRLLGSR
jgi:hypothetical protein